MKTYSVTACCDRTFFVRYEVEAEDPEAALVLAKEQVHSEDADKCANDYSWDTFSIVSGEESPLNWRDKPARIRDAAPKLLETLQDVRQWIASGDIDGVFFDEGTVLDVINAAIANAIGTVA